MKKVFSIFICLVMILANCRFVLAEENEPFKNLKSESIKNVMQNTVMLRPGSPEAFAYGIKYDLYKYGEDAEVTAKEGEVFVKSGFLNEVFPEKNAGTQEETGVFAFAENNGLKAQDVNGTIYIFEEGYSLPSDISANVDKFFGIYVKPGAKGTGTFQSPVGSVLSAKNMAAALKNNVGLPDGGITVYFREGNYIINTTILFNEKDSGLEGSPIIYRAYKDEDVAFDGGVSVKGSEFKAVSDLQVKKKLPDPDKVVCVDLSSKLAGFSDNFKKEDPAMWSVFYDDQALSVARWPDKDYTLTGEVLDDGGGVRGVGFSFVIGDSRVKNWVNEDDARIFGYFGFDWAGERRIISSVDTQKLSITTNDFAEYGVSSGKRYYVYNMICELDAPGEFYFDKKTNYLYFYPVEGDPNNSEFLNNEVQFSLLSQEMITMNGTSYVDFKNITFENSLALAMNVNETCSNVGVKGCTFKNISNGIDLYGFNNTVTGCDFYNISVRPLGAFGGDRNTLTHSGNVISNNKFWNFNITSRTNTSAIYVKGCGDLISHNEIIDSPHTAMAMGGNDNIIEYNELYNNLVDQAHDAGMLYGGRNLSEQGNIIRYNYFHDPSCHSIGVVYFDDGMSGNYVDTNVFENTGTGVFVHGGVCTEITNNLFLNGTGSGVGYSSYGGSWKMETATSLPANTLLWNLKQFPYTSEPWQKYSNVLKYLEVDEDPILMYETVIANNICVNKEVSSGPERDLPYMTIENNEIISGEDAANYEIPEKYAEIMKNAGVYIDENRTELSGLSEFDLLRPYNKQEDVEGSEVYFEWGESDNASGYQFTLATDKEFKNIISNKIVKNNFVTIPKLNYFNTRYYWKVKAIANDTNSVAGDENMYCRQDYYSFTTKAFEEISKDALFELIEVCENTIPDIVEGENPGEYKQGTVQAMRDMISTYTLAANSETLSQKDVNNLTETLREDFERLTYRKNPAVFDMETMVKSGNKWNFAPNQVTFTPEKLTFINLGASTLGTLEKVGTHEIFKFNAMMDGIDNSWYGLALRAQNSPTAVAWGGNPQYLFIIKKDTIEFQKWGDENLLIEYPNEYIKSGQWHEYEISAIDQDDGSVTVTLKVDGNVVVEYEDKVNPITKPGFFEIYNMGSNYSIEISPVKE